MKSNKYLGTMVIILGFFLFDTSPSLFYEYVKDNISLPKFHFHSLQECKAI